MSVGAPVRVVFLTHSLAVGGAEELILNLVTRLPRERFEAIVCTFEQQPGPMASEIAAHGIEVVALGVTPGLRRPWGWWTIVACLRRLRPQIVHTYLLPASLYGRAAAWVARVPVIIGTEVNIYERKQQHHILAERWLAGVSSSIVASAESVKRAYVQQLGIDPDRVRVIYNAVNWDRLRATSPPAQIRRELGIPEERLVVGVVATLQEKKGHRVLFDAAAAGVERVWLMLVGDGPLRAELEEYAATLGIRDRVTFCGTRRDLGSVLPAMDIFALPSLWEGLPLALILAMGAGRPVVATNIAGIPEVVTDGRSGLLVPPGDPSAMRHAIARLAADPDARRRMGEEARAAVSNRFGAEVYVASVASLYEECLNRTVRGRSRRAAAAA